MARKHMNARVEKLLRDGMDNVEILDRIREEFPKLCTTRQQIRSFRYELRRNGENIPTSIQARHRNNTKKK